MGITATRVFAVRPIEAGPFICHMRRIILACLLCTVLEQVLSRYVIYMHYQAIVTREIEPCQHVPPVKTQNNFRFYNRENSDQTVWTRRFSLSSESSLFVCCSRYNFSCYGMVGIIELITSLFFKLCKNVNVSAEMCSI